MKPGIYALASLDGAPLNPADLTLLGLGAQSVRVPGLAASAHDPQTEAIDLLHTADSVIFFAGFLDAPEELSGGLGLSQTERPAALAAAALARFGAEAPRHLLGEWTLLRWDVSSRALTLLVSEARRDLLYFAVSPSFLAIAPSALLLTSLSWMDRALDPLGFAISNSRAALRHIKTDQTMWRGVREFMPGSRHTISAGEHVTARVSPEPPPVRFAGTFDEAIEEIEAIGRRIMRQHLTRHGRSALLLSGGLDSTLLASWGASERGPGADLFCLTSVAPPGSRLPDEHEPSSLSAAMLDLPLQGVWPPAEADPFRPAPKTFAIHEGTPDTRFLILEQLAQTARANGASALISGSAGEMHISNGFDEPESRSWPRLQAAALRDRLAHRRRYSGWPADAFHLRLSPELLMQLPAEWGTVWRKGLPPPPPYLPSRTNPDPLIGYSPTARKLAAASTAEPGDLRSLLPYRDLRLLRLTAGMPARFLRHGGLTRPIARALLQGRVPDSVRLHRSGRPFSPDYVPRLKAFAPRVEDRLDAFRHAGIGRWLDLDWLAPALRKLSTSKGDRDYSLYYLVQSTVLYAEFLLWVSAQNITF